MDYEKKYNEALKWMRELYPGLHGATKEDAEHFFPELRESEDERVIRTLCYLVKDHDWLNGATKEEVLTWLEKQKEPHIPWYDYQKSKEAGYTIVPNEEYEQLVKQKEQEPQVFCEAKAYDLGYKQGKEDAKKEQKPEEKQDYSGLNDLERAIHRGFFCAGMENVPVAIIKDTAKDCLAQIEPPLWSKEDDVKMIELIISIFKVNHPNGLFKVTDSGDVSVRYIHTSDIIAFLKSKRGADGGVRNC